MTVNLRCASWRQLDNIHQRDLKRSAFFMRASKKPPIGTPIRIILSLPSSSTVVLNGTVSEHVPEGGLGGRGPGIDIKLEEIPQSAMWLIETALESMHTRAKERAATEPSVGVPPEPPPDEQTSPNLDGTQQIAEVEDDLVAALRHEHESLKRFNAFQILGVGYGATDADVREAFGALSKRYHPDRFAQYHSGNALQMASEIFLYVRNAYQKLSNAESRQRALEEIQNRRSKGVDRPAAGKVSPDAAPPPPAQDQPTPRLKSEPDTQTNQASGTPLPLPAEDTTKQEVVQPIAHEATMAPAQPEAPSSNNGGPDDAANGLLNAEQLLESGDFDGAMAIYLLSSKKNPGDPLARAGIELVEGLRALNDGDRMEAGQRFEAVLDLDPSNTIAALQLAEMRRQATSERRGALAKLLQKMG